MKWLKALLGLGVIGAFVYGVWYLKHPKAAVSEPVVVSTYTSTVDSGTEVPLILVTPLDSGATPVGKLVTLVAAEDVKGTNGKVVVEQGAIAHAKVSKSREGTVLGSISNQPARLEIELLDIVAKNGKRLKLRSSDPEKDFAFDQFNTKVDSKPNVLDAMSDPEARDQVARVARQLVTGENQSVEGRAVTEKQLRELSARYGLISTQALFNESNSKRKTDVSGVIESVQKGDLKGLTGMDLLLVAKAAGEVIELGSGIDKSLRGIFKGNNIHAKVGLTVKAFVAERSTIKAKSAPSKRPSN